MENSSLKNAAYVLLIISTVIQGFFLLPLFWCIPMTVSYSNKIKKNKPVSTGFKVCVLLFVNWIAGILMLCDKEPKKKTTKEATPVNIEKEIKVEDIKPIQTSEKIQEKKINKGYENMDDTSAYSILKKYYWLYSNNKINEDEYMSLKEELLAGLYKALNNSKDFTDYELDKFHCDLLVECKKMLDNSLITNQEFKYLKGEI